ncbi:LRR receptor-like serine/threonine-protein kinase FLS2 isoform X5 [Olea europaea var. sylvestris]|uniref:non-specific serine/threonine protein kinase n=1 Tax=Olea europaea subsp. europaea TaxID=158383 RepID=A0A8S0QCF7_OLEEU|nr:LRR receptor-like serine/threonine-protein kinase FLS2 isoform X5 [Olea europaea var. sylvestris]CAA2965521.1 probable LRR receptor-like serine threonine-kinase At3g47570 isoform X3 [Olea europaea subsp. europaea]
MQMANYFLGAILFLHCLIAACLAMATTNITTDQSSLLSFKTHIKLDSSHILSKNWSVSTSVCVWIGVTCGLRHQRVTALDISRMNLTGKIPSQLGNLSFLISINITGNYFLGSVPKELIQLRRLKFMDLSVNKFSGEIPSWLHFLTKLQVLYLYTNSFTGFIPPSLFNISTLQFLDFSFNPLQGKIPEEIGNLHNLKILALQDNRLTGVIPLQIFNISTMKIFAFTGNNLTGNLPLNICHGFPRLQGLYLSKNELGGEIPSNLSECLQLQDLSLSNNRFSGSIPGEIGRIRTLQNLLLGSNDLYGAIPRELGNLDNLKELDMGSNFLNGSIPASIFNISSLQHIDFERCNLSGAIPRCIGNITTLRYLYIDTNRLTSSIPASLWLQKDLLGLNLSANTLSGSLPQEIGKLKATYLIDLSVNRFSGSIPSAIGDLLTLSNLFLAHNALQGSIPESMGKMLNLEQLDLSHNNLSGNIPKSLEALKYLSYLNISFNDLSGEVPSAGPFKNFSSESFMSNEGLCGDPLYGLPSCPTGRQKRSKQMLIVVFSLLGITFLILIVTALATYAIGKCRRKYLVENGVDFAPVTTLRVSYYELLRATEGYSESHLLGTGSLGSVYRGTLNNGRDVAVKVFNLQQQNAFKSFEVECEVLRNLRHRNLCKVISTCSNPDFKALVLEYMSNGSLEKWLYSNDNVLDILQRINIMIDVAYALEYLHYGYSTPIVHCDLKPSNVLLDENMVAYLSDFGIAKLLGEGESNANTTTLGTLGYIAPEYGLEGSVSIKCDVYSYGIMLMEVFTRMKPNDEKYSGDLTLRSWVNDSMPNAITQIVDSNLLGPEELSTKKLKCLLSIMELALNCSIESAGERVNMKEVVVALKNIRFQLLT